MAFHEKKKAEIFSLASELKSLRSKLKDEKIFKNPKRIS